MRLWLRVSLRGLAILTVLIVPLRIAARDYLSTGEALHHSGLAVAGKEWGDVLVRREGAPTDCHPGFGVMLRGLRATSGASAPGLARLCVVALFLGLSLPPLLALRRPEAWLLSLLILAVAEARALPLLLQGQPFLLTSAALVLGCVVWPRARAVSLGPAAALAVALTVAAVSWVDPGWGLFVVPFAALLAAREWRAGLRVAACAALGVLLAAFVSGDARGFLDASLRNSIASLALPATPDALASEAAPLPGSPLLVLAVMAILIWRGLRGSWNAAVVDNPVFLAVLGCWALGFAAPGLWMSCGVPALLVFMAREIEQFVEERPAAGAASLTWAAAAALAVTLAWTENVGGRWSLGDRSYAVLAEPQLEAALPDAGGILYTDEPALFGQLFWRLPRAPWRYVLGFAPGWMPREDFTVWRSFRETRSPASLGPWVARMRGADRLILRTSDAGPPPLAGLVWSGVGHGLWSGRVPTADPRPPQ